MLYYAAEGTAAGVQMEHILKYADLMDGRSDPKSVLMAFREATRLLTKSSKKEAEVESAFAQDFRLVIANRVFIQKNSDINADFLETVQKNLKIDFEHIDFEAETESLSEIERWLKEKIQANFVNVHLPEGLVDRKYHGARMVRATPYDSNMKIFHFFYKKSIFFVKFFVFF